MAIAPPFDPPIGREDGNRQDAKEISTEQRAGVKPRGIAGGEGECP